MRKINLLLSMLFITAGLFAQAPNNMSYQSIIRNASNNLLVNQAVGLKISILKGSTSGTVVYSETHQPTSNANGLISISIGSGTVQSGVFSTIDWAIDSYFLSTEVDPTGGTNYTINGVSQLLTVPYSFYSKECGSSRSIQTLIYTSSGF